MKLTKILCLEVLMTVVYIQGCASQSFSKSQQCNGLKREMILAQNSPSQNRTFASPYSVEKLQDAYQLLECDQ